MRLAKTGQEKKPRHKLRLLLSYLFYPLLKIDLIEPIYDLQNLLREFNG